MARYRIVLLVLLGIAFAAARNASAQEPVSLTVRVMAEGAPVEGARVGVAGVSGVTDAAGTAVLRLAPGRYTLRVQRLGLQPAERAVAIGSRDTLVIVEMAAAALEHEAVVVLSTRAERRIEDEPLRVEVVGREEIEEKLLMTPGDVAMLLNETAGLRVQPTAPSIGGASVRIQGLRGRYTQILADGLPLYGAQTGALGPLQIPPMDLAQVEVIKGVASALYGASALGGVVNLVSRRPGAEREHEVLLNQSTLGGTDAILWASQPAGERWGYTLLASGHRQSAADVDDDGWRDLPWFRRALLRPRLYWDNGAGSRLLLTVGAMTEDREGGTDHAGTAAGSFREALATRRADAGLVARTLLGGSVLFSARGSATTQRHDHDFGDHAERDRHVTAFGETSLAGTTGRHTWVVGAAVQHEQYRARDVAGFDYDFTTPGVFAQDEFATADWLTLAASARLDRHTRYGTFLSPRASVLLRPAEEWAVRASAGTGFFAPTPWVEETDAVGLARVTGWNDLEPERARSASFDLGRTIGDVELNATLFTSTIRDPVRTRLVAGTLLLENAAEPVRTWGSELLARFHRDGIHATATYVFTRSTELDPAGSRQRREVPLTPRHTVGLVAAFEQEERGRAALEFYYTGRQLLEDNPYRSAALPHVIIGFLVERRIGPVRAFLNAENLLDTRQTRHDPLLLPARSPHGRWTTDVWAPLEGRSFNAGLRVAF